MRGLGPQEITKTFIAIAVVAFFRFSIVMVAMMAGAWPRDVIMQAANGRCL